MQQREAAAMAVDQPFDSGRSWIDELPETRRYSRHGDDRLREECGVFGIFGHPEAAAITALGVHEGRLFGGDPRVHEED